MKPHVVPATGSRLRTALSVLYSALPPDEQAVRIANAEAASADGSLDLNHLLLAELNHEPAGALMLSIQETGIGSVWPPIVAPQFAEPKRQPHLAELIEDALLQEAAGQLDAYDAWIGQSLLNVGQIHEQAALGRNGFRYLTELIFFERSLCLDSLLKSQTSVAATALASRLTSATYRVSRDRLRFASLLEATYCGTLDCPELNGVRSAAQSLANHEAAGNIRSDMWRRYRLNGADVGLLLSVNRPEQRGLEVIYLGVIVSARCRGVARTMLTDSIQLAQKAGVERLLIAADVRNAPARRLYESLGFVENSRKVACVRLRGVRHDH